MPSSVYSVNSVVQRDFMGVGLMPGKSKMKGIPFFQDGPVLGNQYQGDLVLRAYLQRVLPPEVLAEIEPDLSRMGERTASDLLRLGREAEALPPKHIIHDSWGRRLDQIEVSGAWENLGRVSAEEGLVAIGYERKYGPWSRVYQFAKLYLFHPSSAFYTCPLAMTDGAARAVEVYGGPELRERAFARLTSRDPDFFWTSGQWMTERTGGSDVGGTSTVAKLENGSWRLYGEKWFASAVTAPMAMALARPEGAEPGSKGLSLFLVETKDPQGRWNHIKVQRLKDKMGTKALPTAELELEGVPASPVGGLGQGVKKISALFNITRIHNSVYAASFMRRGTALARDYARKRRAFGRALAETPLHLETLSELEVGFRAAFALAFRAVELLGRVETGKAGPGEPALLRIVTPLAKLSTGKQAVEGLSEVAECFGGAGYVEDTGIPVLLRDAHVLPIWEGTTNVLGLDVLRAILKDGALGALLEDIKGKLASVQQASLEKSVRRVLESCSRLEGSEPRPGGNLSGAGARSLALSLSRTYCGALLLEQAQWGFSHGGDRLAEAAAIRWCARELFVPSEESPEHIADSKALALSEDGPL